MIEFYLSRNRDRDLLLPYPDPDRDLDSDLTSDPSRDLLCLILVEPSDQTSPGTCLSPDVIATSSIRTRFGHDSDRSLIPVRVAIRSGHPLFRVLGSDSTRPWFGPICRLGPDSVRVGSELGPDQTSFCCLFEPFLPI